MNATCRKKKPRRAPNIKGISKDASSLGVTRDHLRLVLQGKRPSASLKERYTRLKQVQQVVRHSAPLQENFCTEFQILCDKFKISIIAVQLDYSLGDQNPVLKQPDLATPFNAELLEQHAGNWDDSSFLDGCYWHFYHTGSLAKALQVLKSAIEKRGLLNHARIFLCEPPPKSGWQMYWPNTAEFFSTHD